MTGAVLEGSEAGLMKKTSGHRQAARGLMIQLVVTAGLAAARQGVAVGVIAAQVIVGVKLRGQAENRRSIARGQSRVDLIHHVLR